MDTIPDPVSQWTPWAVLDYAQACYDMLEEHCCEHGGSYSIERDQTYRDYWMLVGIGLADFPFFIEKKNTLPVTLSNATCVKRTWYEGQRQQAARFISRLVASVQRAGIPWREAPDTPRDGCAATTNEAVPTLGASADRVSKSVPRNVRRKLDNQRRALEMAAGGATRKSIATKLGVNVRTVYGYLEPSTSGPE